MLNPNCQKRNPDYAKSQNFRKLLKSNKEEVIDIIKRLNT